MNIDMTVTGLDEARAKVSRIAARVGNLTEPMQTIAIRLQQTNLARLQAGMQADGLPFKPLSPNYVRFTESGNPLPRPYQILVHTGKLRQGILADWTGQQARVSAGNNESRDYVAKHQFGQGVPQRRFLGISQSDLADITTIMDEFVKRVVNE